MRPKIEKEIDDFPDDPRELHEALVDVFGQYLIWCRDNALDSVERLVEDSDAREQIGRVFRKTFEDAATKLDSEQRAIAADLQRKAVGAFARNVLTLLSDTGFSHPISKGHVARFRLVMELCESDEGEIVGEETINRGGERFFPEYWNQWLADYAQSRSA